MAREHTVARCQLEEQCDRLVGICAFQERGALLHLVAGRRREGLDGLDAAASRARDDATGRMSTEQLHELVGLRSARRRQGTIEVIPVPLRV